MTSAVITWLDIIMALLLTVVYRTLPPQDPTSHPLQCSNECVDAARMSLSLLVEIGERSRIHKSRSWHYFLNLYVFPSPTRTILSDYAGHCLLSLWSRS